MSYKPAEGECPDCGGSGRKLHTDHNCLRCDGDGVIEPMADLSWNYGEKTRKWREKRMLEFLLRIASEARELAGREKRPEHRREAEQFARLCQQYANRWARLREWPAK